MDEDYDVFDMNGFSYDVLCLYIWYGYGNAQMKETNFFICTSENEVNMSLYEYFLKAHTDDKKSIFGKVDKDFIFNRGVENEQGW